MDAITVKFDNTADKETTRNLMQTIKAKTGQSMAEILNRAIRLYWEEIK